MSHSSKTPKIQLSRTQAHSVGSHNECIAEIKNRNMFLSLTRFEHMPSFCYFCEFFLCVCVFAVVVASITYLPSCLFAIGFHSQMHGMDVSSSLVISVQNQTHANATKKFMTFIRIVLMAIIKWGLMPFPDSLKFAK